MKTKLQEILKKIIKELYSIENSEIILENPPKKDLWDFAFWPFLLAKELKKSPIEIWKEIIEELKKYPEITDVAQAWPYINIFFWKKCLYWLRRENYFYWLYLTKCLKTASYRAYVHSKYLTSNDLNL